MFSGGRKYGWLVLVPLLLALVALLPTTASAKEGARQDVHPAVDVYAELFPGEKIPSSSSRTILILPAGSGSTAAPSSRSSTS